MPNETVGLAVLALFGLLAVISFLKARWDEVLWECVIEIDTHPDADLHPVEQVLNRWHLRHTHTQHTITTDSIQTRRRILDDLKTELNWLDCVKYVRFVNMTIVM